MVSGGMDHEERMKETQHLACAADVFVVAVRQHQTIEILDRVEIQPRANHRAESRRPSGVDQPGMTVRRADERAAPGVHIENGDAAAPARVVRVEARDSRRATAQTTPRSQDTIAQRSDLHCSIPPKATTRPAPPAHFRSPSPGSAAPAEPEPDSPAMRPASPAENARASRQPSQPPPPAKPPAMSPARAGRPSPSAGPATRGSPGEMDQAGTTAPVAGATDPPRPQSPPAPRTTVARPP